MRKVLIIRCPLESAEGGAEHHTIWLADGLQQRGYSIEFLGSCPVLLRRMKERGYTVHPLEIGPPPVTMSGALSFTWRKRQMKQSLLQAIDRIASGESLSIFMLSLTEKLLVSELAASEHRVYWIEHDRIGRWLRWNPWLPLLRRQHAHATMITVSELSRDLMIECGFEADRIVPIPNGVPLPPTPSLPRPCHHPFSVGCIARFSHEKGVDVLIESLQNDPDIDVHLLGRGPQEFALRQLIQEDRERTNIDRFHLYASVASVDEFFKKIDILVLPSRDHDPFGLVVAEAMVRGIPVVVTSCCGIVSEIIHGNHALIIPPDDPSALRRAILELKNAHRRDAIAVRGMTHARQTFSIETMVDHYACLLERASTLR